MISHSSNKSYNSNPYDIKPFDIFFANKQNDYRRSKHYYICVYTQREDVNNNLTNDIYGLLVTTNPKYSYFEDNDYNVAIEINGKDCYVCCDKLVRMKIDRNVELKGYFLNNNQIKEIKVKLSKFFSEVNRQLKIKKESFQ